MLKYNLRIKIWTAVSQSIASFLYQIGIFKAFRATFVSVGIDSRQHFYVDTFVV